ncbi:hypothetical protein [Bordetella flabilis]|uniref:Uncharacterized protein n=1 Tax=Bordetella flabilis TaxID=463014 RepID=A0A193G7D6_9BORD|nr:hypothetical protein [Bordetella flabilis]ANN75730.1 hypothetical protein BAU07_00100 [Bordetella flabilis]
MAPQQGSNPIAPHTHDLLKENRSDVPRDVPPRDEYNPSDGRSGSRDEADAAEGEEGTRADKDNERPLP